MQRSVSSPAANIQLSHLSSQLKGLGSSAKAHLTPSCKWHHLIYYTIWVLACAACACVCVFFFFFLPGKSLSPNENSFGLKFCCYVLHHMAKKCKYSNEETNVCIQYVYMIKYDVQWFLSLFYQKILFQSFLHLIQCV